MVDILYDGPDALVTSRLLLIRTRPSQTLWTDRINRPRVVAEPLTPTQVALIQVTVLIILVFLVIWPATRRPAAFVVAAAVMVAAAAMLATARRRRRYTLCCEYEDRRIDLLTSTNRGELKRISKAILAADRDGLDPCR